MSTITITSIEIEQEAIPFHMPSRQKHDPNWRCKDHHGNERSWDDLVWIVDSRYWCESCQDYHDEGHWEIKDTGDRVKPGYVWVPAETRHVPGIRHISGTFVSARKPPMGERILWKDCGWEAAGERPELDEAVLVTECKRAGNGGWEGRWV